MTISIRLTDEEEARLNNLALRTGRSKSICAKVALHEYLTDLGDTFAAGGRRSRPLSELEAETER